MGVNAMPFLNTNEEMVCTMPNSLHTHFMINCIDKGFYCTGIKFCFDILFWFYVYIHFITFLCVGSLFRKAGSDVSGFFISRPNHIATSPRNHASFIHASFAPVSHEDSLSEDS
jgi:hypothetical protein